MFDFNRTFNIIRIPLIILVLLTCLGILINITNIFLLIFAWWSFVFLALAICLLWVGHASGSNGFSVVETGINGIVTWLVPGATGLIIAGIISFINALLWGSIEGYEIIAFLIGLTIIFVALAVGSIGAFIVANIGRFIGQMMKKK